MAHREFDVPSDADFEAHFGVAPTPQDEPGRFSLRLADVDGGAELVVDRLGRSVSMILTRGGVPQPALSLEAII